MRLATTTMSRRTGALDRLYVGTTERIAKLAPVAGLSPGKDPLYLTTVYAGYFAFYAATRDDERYGIIEVDVSYLKPELLLPCEWYLEQSKARKPRTNGGRRAKPVDLFRRNLGQYQDKWKDSLKNLGVCVYGGPISKKAVRRVCTYDPLSNSTITQAIVATELRIKDHQAALERNRLIARWLMCEEINPEGWFGDSKEATKAEREQIAESLQSKWGLDLFYDGTGKHH